ncbi:unnamed protein product, partial [marine sediment metagenome]
MAVALLFGGTSLDASAQESRPHVLSILSYDDPAIAISDDARSALKEVGFTKCSMPFGVLIGADEAMPDAYVQATINVVAELLDLDGDG